MSEIVNKIVEAFEDHTLKMGEDYWYCEECDETIEPAWNQQSFVEAQMSKHRALKAVAAVRECVLVDLLDEAESEMADAKRRWDEADSELALYYYKDMLSVEGWIRLKLRRERKEQG